MTAAGTRGARRVLVLVDGELGPGMRGPALRGWEPARALAGRHEVTVAVRGAERGRRDGIALMPYRRAALLRAARGQDAVLATWLPPYLLARLARCAGASEPAALARRSWSGGASRGRGSIR